MMYSVFNCSKVLLCGNNLNAQSVKTNWPTSQNKRNFSHVLARDLLTQNDNKHLNPYVSIKEL